VTCQCCVAADNGKFDAEVTAAAERVTDDGVSDMNEIPTDKKTDSVGGPPARPQPPVSIACCSVSAYCK